MSVQDRGKNLVDQGNDRVAELTNSLREVERKLSEREALINQAFDQTEAARSQYSQAVERAEALSRRIDSSSSELKAANESIATLTEKVSSLENELQLRDSRIAFLEQMCTENENALEAIHDDIDRSDSALHAKPFSSIGYVIESLDNVEAKHRICRLTTTIGRASTNDISINASSISRYHARLVIEPEGLFLIDLKSTNGCRVNSQKITRRKLNDGDAIFIGDAKFRLSMQPAADVGDDTASNKPGFDDQLFTHTVVSLSRTAIQELPIRAKA